MFSQRLKNIGQGLLISLAAIVFVLIVLEIGVRLFVRVTDYPIVQYYPGVGIHLAPNQSGIRTYGPAADTGGRYRINNAGWNSLRDYTRDKAPDTLRIAVVGDSFIEGMQVDIDKRFDVTLEARLKSDPACARFKQVEVYDFGFYGTPLSQYLSYLRDAAANYPADLYIVNIVYNDFEQSWVRRNTRSYLLHFRLTDQGQIEEVPTRPWQSNPLGPLVLPSALFRYLYFNVQITEKFSALRAALSATTPPTPQPAPAEGEDAAVDVFQPGSPQEQHMPDLVKLILSDMQTATSKTGGRLLLTLDADRIAIYGQPQPADIHFKYSGLVKDTASQLGIDVLDLTTPFTQDWQANHQPFNFADDYHWNVHGHAVVGAAMAGWVSQNVCAAK